MELLNFARGPALQWSLAIFIFGITWRLVGVAVLNWPKDFSEPRSKKSIMGALRMMAMRSWPHKEFLPKTWYSEVMGYTFHIGFFAVFLLYVPHIIFIEALTGLSWPGLPEYIVYFLSIITLFALIAVLIRRLTHPVLRMLSNFDDYMSWLMTISPIVTGLLVTSHAGLGYETLLAIHILNIDLLLLWFPFSKLMHAFFIWSCRGVTGAAFARKGIPAQ